MRKATAAVFLAVAMMGIAPTVSGADVSKLPQARYDDPTNTFTVIDNCGDGLGSELQYRIGSGPLNLHRVAECGRGTARLVGALEDAPLVWRVCSDTVCSPWHKEDV
jgi:hypothetical protein